MNYYEEHIIKLENRIKKIEANPDPTKPKSNILRYKLDLQLAKEQLEGWRTRRPFSDGGSLLAGSLTRAMGFVPIGSVEPAFQTREPQKYLQRARDMGLPVDQSCDMTMMPFAMMECGDLPLEDLTICDQHACTPMMLRGIHVAHTAKVLTYYIDLGFAADEVNLKYVTDQLRDFIKFAENKFPGVIKYDEAKLAESQKYEEEIRLCNNEIYEMVKNKPTPIHGKDLMPRDAARWGATRLDAEYARAKRDEVARRVEGGKAAVPGERLRVLWTGVTAPIFMDPYKVLAKWGIAVFRGVRPPGQGNYTGEPFWGDRELSPLEKVAVRWIGNTSARNVERSIWLARDLRLDAIINYNMLGCTTALGFRKWLEDKAEKQLGIPTLQLEGKQLDVNYASEETITRHLDEFAQMLLNRKGLL
ncbi:2-hydroxyacyl-CoA dehydratase [Thermodesulfobacteriota bacterium]